MFNVGNLAWDWIRPSAPNAVRGKHRRCRRQGLHGNSAHADFSKAPIGCVELVGAPARTRTGMAVNRRILSPLRLPIPPRGLGAESLAEAAKARRARAPECTRYRAARCGRAARTAAAAGWPRASLRILFARARRRVPRRPCTRGAPSLHARGCRAETPHSPCRLPG